MRDKAKRGAERKATILRHVSHGLFSSDGRQQRWQDDKWEDDPWIYREPYRQEPKSL